MARMKWLRRVLRERAPPLNLQIGTLDGWVATVMEVERRLADAQRWNDIPEVGRYAVGLGWLRTLGTTLPLLDQLQHGDPQSVIDLAQRLPAREQFFWLLLTVLVTRERLLAAPKKRALELLAGFQWCPLEERSLVSMLLP